MLNVHIEWTPETAANELLGCIPYLPGLEPPGPRNTPENREALEHRILEAILCRRLKAERLRLTGNDGRLIYQWRCCPIDVIEWAIAENIDVPDRYREWFHQVADRESVEIEPVVDESPKKNPTHPKLLTTPEIGLAFNGINGWTDEQWGKNIVKAGWAKPARTNGPGKPKPDLWNPVELVKCLLKKYGDAESESLFKAFDKAFLTHRHLADWKSEWANYAEHWGINPPT